MATQSTVKIPTPSKESFISIKGARMHNLKNVDVHIPRNKLVVVTGVSGSGKSSLVFDTLYAEGQRRYVESLSAYARQFMGRMNKPDVDYIKGIAPAIAIEQKVNTRNPRSTVATTTEIYDYMKLLFARAGRTYSPVSGMEVKSHSVEDVVNNINSHADDTKVFLMVALHHLTEKKELKKELDILLQKGFSRLNANGEVVRLEEFISDGLDAWLKQKAPKTLFLLVDRFTVNKTDEDHNNRIADSVQTTFQEGNGECLVELVDAAGKRSLQTFSNKFEADGQTFERPSVNFFSFNNPYGACKTCEGFGSVIGIDEDLVVPDKSLSIYEDAIAPWKGEKMSEWKEYFIKYARKADFPIHRPYFELNKTHRDVLWRGNKEWEGINGFFTFLEGQTYKIQYRVMLARYRGKTTCPDCMGTRLRPDANFVKLADTRYKTSEDYRCLSELMLMSVSEARTYFEELKLNEHDHTIAARILTEIRNRLNYLDHVGLGYLSLNRLSNTLSGGETQRINLATSLGSSLVGSMYILDEPSIGLHSRDTEKLITVLKQLRDVGNTVIVVEHDEEIMQVADHIIDMGPLAGVHGGEVMAEGTLAQLKKDKESLTGQYLSHHLEIPVPAKRRKWNEYIEVCGARHNNLKNVSVKFPLHVMSVVTGVSGSGKTTLVKNILYPALQKHTGNYAGEKTGTFDKLQGQLKSIKQVELVDQNPIGKSSRSNPVTYIKAYDSIRDLFSQQPLSKNRGFKPQHFSFNVEGGRCETCQGEGEVTVEMQFMADIHLVCEDCKGHRFKDEVLEVTYRSKNISDVLRLSVDEALEFFKDEKSIVNKIRPLSDVGLGYVQLGQSSSTLSGGEAQRIKLASFLGKSSNSAKEHILFIFDEPTTGLHFHDIQKLMQSFQALIEQGNSVLIIEHNLEVIKCADWIIDLGPEGGDAGGQLVFAGLPEDLVKEKKSYTGKYLKEKL